MVSRDKDVIVEVGVDTKGAAKKMTGMAKGLGGVHTAALGAAGALAGVSVALGQQVSRYVETARELDKVNTLTGVAPNYLDAWSRALEGNGAELNDLQEGLLEMRRLAEENKDTFVEAAAAIGLSTDEALAPTGETLYEIADAIAKVNEEKGAAAATKISEAIFGESDSTHLFTTLTEGSGKVRDFDKSLTDMGGAWDRAKIEQAEELAGNMAMVNTKLEALANTLTASMIPAMNDLLGLTLEVVKGLTDAQLWAEEKMAIPKERQEVFRNIFGESLFREGGRAGQNTGWSLPGHLYGAGQIPSAVITPHGGTGEFGVPTELISDWVRKEFPGAYDDPTRGHKTPTQYDQELMREVHGLSLSPGIVAEMIEGRMEMNEEIAEIDREAREEAKKESEDYEEDIMVSLMDARTERAETEAASASQQVAILQNMHRVKLDDYAAYWSEFGRMTEQGVAQVNDVLGQLGQSFAVQFSWQPIVASVNFNDVDAADLVERGNNELDRQGRNLFGSGASAS